MKTAATSGARKDERVNLRVDAKTKALLMQAAELSGVPLTEFLVQTALERADRLMSQPKATLVSREAFFRVLDLIENPPPPTDYLIEAMQKFK